MSLRVRIRWLLVVSAAICVALATVALYWVNLSLVDTLAERNAEPVSYTHLTLPTNREV